MHIKMENSNIENLKIEDLKIEHKHFDVIIIGAGIAGCGLAYNLKRAGFSGSVLVIDKKGAGANRAYGYRILFEDTLKEYNFKYYHTYKGIKVGINDAEVFTINGNFYLCDYKIISKQLLLKSSAKFKRETAIDLKSNILKTDKNNYYFKYLIDCSGTNYFLKRKLNHKLPIRYWLGDVKVLENNEAFDDKYLYYLFDESGYMEDFYPLKDKILQGDWNYTKKIDFNLIKVPEKTLLKKIKKIKIIRKEFVIDPVAPCFPLVYKNYAFLGDSFGGGTPSAGVGIDSALEASKMLSLAIMRNDLEIYEDSWKKKYLKPYLWSLASRLDRYHNSPLIQKIKNYPKNMDILKLLKNYPDLFLKLCKNDVDFKFPKEINEMFPTRRKIFILLTYIYLRLKFLLS